MILKISFLVVSSIAAVAVSHIGIGSSTSRKRNTTIKSSENVDSSYRQEQEQIEAEEEEKIADSNVSIENKQKEEDGMKQNMEIFDTIEFPLQVNKLKKGIDTDILQNLVKEVEQRRVIVERKLLKLYGLEEEQSYVAQLQKQLKAKTGEINKLNITMNLLQADRNELLGEIKLNRLANKQLEAAKTKIMEMQAKMGVDANKMKGQLNMLEERVSGFEMEESNAKYDIVDKKLKALKDAKLEVVEIKMRNRELQLEKRDLTLELAAAEARVAALSNMTESKIVGKVEGEMLSLRQANKDLSKQTERLHKNRLGMVEELVYQRWLNACLRFEVQNYQDPSRMNQTPNVNKISSNESPKETKQLMSCLSFDSISSPISSPDTDSDEIKSTTTSFESYPSSQTSISRKSSLFNKIKKWGKSMDNLSHISSQSNSSSPKTMSRTSLIRRFSMSMVPSHASMPREKERSENITETSQTPRAPRKRRVSFSDAVMTFPSTLHYMRTPGEVTCAEESSSCNTTVDENSKNITDQLGETEKPESPVPELATEKTDHENDVKTGVAHIEEFNLKKPVVLGTDTKTETERVDFMITCLIFFILILLAYCIPLTAMIFKA